MTTGRHPDIDAWFAERRRPLEAIVRQVRALAPDELGEQSIGWQTSTCSFHGDIVSFDHASDFEGSGHERRCRRAPRHGLAT